MNLVELEARLRNLLEARLTHLLPSGRLELLMAGSLAESIRRNTPKQAGATPAAPSIFTIVVHPDSAAELEQPHVIDAIRAAVHVAMEDAGLRPSAPPRLAVAVDASVPPHDLRVIASNEIQAAEDTHSPPPDAEPDPAEVQNLHGAYFILQGARVVPILGSVTNIGRRLDNHLVVDDPRVSRNHAQLRLVGSRFLIFDLGSSGGTFVNETRITQSELHPGDVLSLAGVSLVFGQDRPREAGETGETNPTPTPPASPPPTLQMPPAQSPATRAK
jgi:hypothetical protein